jgi:hypothetical protein
MNTMATIGTMIVTLLLFQLTNYGLGLWVLKTSRNTWSDLWWLAVVFALPFGLLEFFWLQAWRVGQSANLSMWTIHVFVLACHVTGSAVAVYVYCGEPPSARNLVGLALVCMGALCCLKAS